MVVRPLRGGITAAHQQLQRDDASGANTGRTPVFILLTDSQDWSSTATVATLGQIMQQESGTGLKMHCLGFGTQVNHSYMEQLAAVDGGAFYSNLGSDDIAR